MHLDRLSVVLWVMALYAAPVPLELDAPDLGAWVEPLLRAGPARAQA